MRPTQLYTTTVALAALSHVALAGANAPGGSLLLHDLPPGHVYPDNAHTWNPLGGAVNNYHIPTIRSAVDGYLQANYNTGQRRVRIMLWHGRNGSSPYYQLFGDPVIVGTVIWSGTGNFPSITRENLAALLTKVRDIGYQEVLVALGPQGHNYVGPWLDRSVYAPHDTDGDGIYANNFFAPPSCSPSAYPGDNDGDGIDDIDSLPFPCHDLWRGSISAWETANEDYFQENWSVIYNIYPLVTGIPGLLVKVDLGNEYTVEQDCSNPECNGSGDRAGGASRYEAGHVGDIFYHKLWGKRANYMWRLWGNVRSVFGSNALTGGFSFETGGGLAAITRKVRGAYQIYDSVGRPYYVVSHFYDENWIGGPDAGQMFEQLHNALNSVGATGEGVIVGESYWNDAKTANDLNLKSYLGRTIWYLIQWPIVRGDGTNGCSQGTGCFVDADGGVMQFQNYTTRGF